MSRPSIQYSRQLIPMAAVNLTPGDTVAIDISGGANAGYAIPPTSTVASRVKGIAVAFFGSDGQTKLGPATSPVGGQNSGGSLGSQFVEVELGVDKNGGLRSFKRTNDSGGGALTQANVGTNIYAKDARVVTSTSTNNSHCGELLAINSDGTVEVQFPISY